VTKKPKLWTLLAAAGALAIALSSAALGANAPVSTPDATSRSANASLPDGASSIARAVLGALTGGSNPSTVASADSNAKTEHSTDAKVDKADKGDKADKADKADTAKDAAKASKDNETADTEANDEHMAEGQETKPASTTATKPGWGCGDENHTHSGPPGRPGATPPPGCTKAKSH
jgi:hypothetical protein